LLHFVLSALLLGGVTHAAESRLALDDIYRTVGVSSPRISPDGTTLLFTRSRVNLDTDKRDNDLVLLDIKSGEQHVLPADRSVHDAAWSPDGSHIAFLADDADHHAQIWLTVPADAHALQLTHSPTGVEQFAWRPDGKALTYLATDPQPKRTGIARWQDAFRVTDNAYLDAGPFEPGHLWLVTVDGAEARLTAGSWSVAVGDAQSTISWSPDGRSIAYVHLPNALLGDADQSIIETLNLTTRRIARLTGRTRYEFNPRYSPDGKYIAYTYARAGDPMNEADIYVSSGRGPGVDLTLKRLDVNATNFAWYPDSKALLVAAHIGTRTGLWRLTRNGVQRLQLGDIVPLGDFDGSIARDGAIAFVGTTAHHPGEIYYRSPSGRLTRLTDYNVALASKPLGAVTTLTWHRDRYTEDGVLTYPAGFRQDQADKLGKRYPLVLLIHGGPTSASTTSWDELAQLMAAHGWFVLRPNYRGSDNLGNAYQHAIYNDATHGPGLDILAGVAAAEKSAPIDPKRVCVSGWSYGGMMTSWLITQDQRWACAVSGAAVNDLVYDYSLADDISADRLSMPGSPFVGNNLQAYRDVSPLTFYRNVKTPTLILSDMYDVRVPAPQSYAFYHALHDNGVPVEFYEWPVHGHFPGDPVRTVDVYRYWIDWIAKHV
jgi:dipeptidyl aminopeptidase/acylaminoacyl peptidase